MFKRFLAALVKSMVFAFALFSIGVHAAPITAGNLVIYRVGDGAAALSASGTAVFLDEYSPTGTLVQSISVPTTTVSTNRRLVASGTATTEGAINRSQDGLYVVLPGYDAATGTASLTSSTSSSVNRVIGRLAVDGTLDTTTALTDAISGGSPRGVASTNGTDLWLTGTSSGGGIRYATIGATSSTSLATTPTNLRAAGIANGQLYASSQSGTFRLSTVGTGTPTTAGQTITNLPGFPTATGSPYAFFFADLDAGVAGNDTLYVADDGGAIQKYSLVSGSWTLNGTITAASVRGLTATVSGTTVTLFVTYSAGSKYATVVDSAGYNVAPSSTTVTDRATAATNTVFRGIALAPSNSVPSTIIANASTTPQTATINTAFSNALAVTVRDASANPVSGVNVTFTAPASGASGTFSNSTATITVATNASGVASAPFTANATAGAYNVSAAVSGLSAINFALTNTAGAAASMTTNSATTPQTVTIGSAFANALAVTVRDAGSNPVSGVNVTFTAPGSGASGTFSNSTTTITVATNASGIASAPFTANATAGGPYNVAASASGVTSVNFAMTNAVGAATSMAANSGTTPQSAAINAAFSNALAVTVRDTGNSPVPGVNVTFTAPGAGASGIFSNSTATITVATDASGIAAAPFTANTSIGGPYNVSAAAAGLTTINFALTNTVGAAASMTANASTTPQSVAINSAFANPLAVTVRDAGSNPVPGVNVTFSAPGSGTSGIFSNSTATITVATNASGIASAPFTANATAGGPYNVAAATAGVSTINFALTNTAGSAASMAANASTTPQSANTSATFTNAPAVTVRDVGNNPVSGVSVTFTAPGSGASGTFSNSTATITVTTNASGIASAQFTANSTAGGPYVVTAASAGLTVVNFSLTNTAVVASTGSIVISQVYGGGGNGGSVYKNDFIEIFNRGVTPVSLAGWSVQYAGATGTSWQVTNLSGTIPGGGYYLVQEAAGAGGTTNLPTPDATGNIAMAATAGKVALVNTTTALATSGCPTVASIVDFVGFGTTANCFEGAGATPAPSNTASVVRLANGCTDSDANSADFVSSTVAPRNSASPLKSCSALPGLSIDDVQIAEGNSGTSTLTFTVSLTAAAGVGGVTFDIATQDNTATAGSDYVAKSLSGQTIPAGVTTYTFDVTINGDIAPEADETFYVNVTNLTGANLVKGQGVGTIVKDDAGVDLSINDVSQNEGNSGTTTFSFTVTLSGPAPAGGVTFDIATAQNTATAPSDYTTKTLTAQTIPEGMTTYTFDVLVNGDTTAEANETFNVNITNIVNAIPVKAQGVGTILNDDVYRIHDVQGNSAASPYANALVTVEGIVTGVFQGTNSLNGFYIQEPDARADADPATSEAVFIYTNLVPASVTVGDMVRVTGTVVEFGTAPNTLTEIVTPTVSVLSTGNALPAIVDVMLPVASLTDLERFEGMRVRFVQTLTVSDHFDLAHFGEVKLKANGRALQPTNEIDLNDDPASGTTSAGTSNLAAVNAYDSLNVRSSIILDDANSKTYPSVVPFVDPVDHTLRLGSTVANLTGIFSQSFGTYRVYATTVPAFNYAPRPTSPPAVGGNVKVASANVLNYFNGDGLGGGFPTSRGANSLLEFNRQRAKTIAAINGLNADVVGLLEMENDGTGPNSAVQDLVNGLNAATSAGTWAIIDDPAGYCCGNAGTTDAIRPVIIYKPAVVTPVGVSSTIVDSAFNIGRAPVAQTFALVSNAEKFTLVMNHFKSKGSGGTGADGDNGDGQAFYNNTRKLQAQALLSFISTLSATTPRIITMGDFNAYEQEDPMDVLRAGGLATIINGDTSYMFAGLSGSLDHALGTATLMSAVSGAGHWHINADEPVFLDYNVETKNTAGCTSSCTTPDYYAATPFRASDHDPVLVGLQLNAPQCLAGNFSINGFGPCTPASAGNFVATAGATSQTPCAAGSYSGSAGATVCTNATAGNFVATTGANSQTPCAVGTFSNSTGATACTPASVGFFVSSTGATSQAACAAGTTSLVTGASACVAITFTVTPIASANGTVAPGVAQTVTIGTTSTFIITANAGFSASVVIGAGECGGSLTGSTYTTASVTANCTVRAIFTAIPAQCLPGNYSATGSAPCTPASPGSFVANTGATTQALCAAGTFSASSGATACSLATAGSFVAAAGATTQTPASAGSFVSVSGASTQTLCTAGSFSPAAGATACSPAAVGFYVPATGATAQTACAAGTTTLTTGATACTPIMFTVTPTAGSNGTISPITPQSVAIGNTSTFTVTANAGYAVNVASGSGNCGGALVNNGYTTAAITANCNVAVTFTLIPLSQTITGFLPTAAVSFGTAPVTLTAVGGGSGNAIVFATTSPANVCTVAGASVTFTGVGTCNLTANQAGATGFAAAPQVTASIVINQASQTINFNPPASVTFASASLALTASASSGLAVSFASSTATVCTVSATTLTLISAGACIVTANQAGNGNYQPATAVTRTIVIGDNTTFAPTVPAYRFGEIMNLTFAVTGNNPTGTVSFSTSDGIPIPGCSALPIVNGTAACLVPSSFSLLNTLPFVASYSGDARNPPSVSYFSRQVQVDQASLTTSVTPVNPIPAGSRATITALVRMRAPTGTVTFYPATSGAESPVAIAGCDSLPIVLLDTATNSAIATCSFTAPQSGSTNIVAVYRYPAGHISNRIFEQEVQPITVIANAPPNYTDMWWAGVRENGWGVSITQHGATQVNIIFTYDNAGKPIWYLMSGCAWNASNTACTGELYQPSGSSFAQYDVTHFLVNAPVGTVTFTYKSINTAVMTYRINGISGTKEIERQVFANSTNQPGLAVNDLWWNGLAENGWGINVSQQGKQLFPVWFTYDAKGQPTFYFVPGGTWNGLAFTGDLYTATSSAWLGVAYDASKFVTTKVGTMTIDYREANTATMTYTVGDVTQTKLIVRQPY